MDFEKINEYMDSPEGQKSLEDWSNKLVAEGERTDGYVDVIIERLHIQR